MPASEDEREPQSTAAEAPTATTTYITNEYITNPTTVIREVVKETVRESGSSGSSIDTSNFVTKDLFYRQTDSTQDSISDSTSNLSDNLSESVETDLLTVSGNGTIDGSFTAATTTLAKLTVSGNATIDGTLTAGALSVTSISSGGAVTAPYFTATSTSATSTFAGGVNIGSGGLVYDRESGNVGVGTTSISNRLSVDGNVRVTGGTGATPFTATKDYDGITQLSVSNPNAGTGAFARFIVSSDSASGFLFAASENNTSKSEFAGGIGLHTSSLNPGDLILAARGNSQNIDFYTGGESAANHRMIIDSSGNVGIGTTSPWGKLSVTGGGTGTGQAFTVADSNDSPLFRVLNNGNVGIGSTDLATNFESGEKFRVFGGSAYIKPSSGINSAVALRIGGNTYNITLEAARGDMPSSYRPLFLGAQRIHFEIDGNERVRIDSSGNVGIGSTAPGSELTVDGGVAIGSGYTAEDIGNGDVAIEGNVGIGTTSPFSKLSVSGDIYADGDLTVSGLTATTSISAPFFTATDSTATSTFAGGINVSSGGLVYDHQTGNVGIGTGGPDSKLHVIDDGINDKLIIEEGGTWSVGDESNIVFYHNNRTVSSKITSYVPGGSDVDLRFYTTQNSSPDKLTMELKGRDKEAIFYGNVGIGMTSPGERLSVQGVDPGSETAISIWKKGSWNAGEYSALGFADSSGTEMARIGGKATGSGDIGLSFYTTTDLGSNVVEQVHIQHDGDVGIGTTSPWGKLSVTGGGTGTGQAFNVADSTDSPLFSVLNNGNVGIGTTTPTTKLHVAGTSTLERLSLGGDVLKNLTGFGLSLVDENIVTDTDTFISTWKTDNTGTSNDDQITLPLESSGTYDFVVDWGDGTQDTITQWDQAEVTHTYASAGTYTVKISGTITGWRFNNGGDAQKITNISQWGPLNFGNNGGYFYGTSNLSITATDVPDLEGTTNMRSAFRDSGISTVPNMNNWDVSNVTTFGSAFGDFAGMFRGASSFNQPLNDWDMSSATDVSAMFHSASSFNQPLDSWDMSNVSRASRIFENASSFNQDIGDWDVSNMSASRGMDRMFRGATAFNQDISSWDVSNVTDMERMFKNATAFNQDISDWDVSSVTDMSLMFNSAGLSTAHYDALLIAWSNLTLQDNVSFDAGSSKYSAGEATTARNNIISTYNWTISDSGEGFVALPNELEVDGGAVIGRGYTSSETAPTDGLLIEGNVGIGTTSPWRTLSVNGTAAFTGLTNDGSGYYACVDVNTGELATSTTACGASSERFKTNIDELTYGLDTINQLRPVSFDWKDDYIENGSPQIGLIAEEVASTVPEVIGYDGEGRITNLDYPKLVAITINAIQEIAGTLAELKDKVAGFAERLVTKEVVTDRLCIADESGETTCLTKSEIDGVLERTDTQSAQSPGEAEETEPPETDEEDSGTGSSTEQTATTTTEAESQTTDENATTTEEEGTDTASTTEETTDTTPPEITLAGAAEIELTEDDSFSEPGYTASDDTDGDITSDVVVGGDTIDTTTPGTYTVTYNVTDAAGNDAEEKTRKVTVLELQESSDDAEPGSGSTETDESTDTATTSD